MRCAARPVSDFVSEEGTMAAGDAIYERFNKQIECARCDQDENKPNHGFMRDSAGKYKDQPYRRYQAKGDSSIRKCLYGHKLTNEEYINNAYEWSALLEGGLEDMRAIDGILETTIDEHQNARLPCNRLDRIRQTWAAKIQALATQLARSTETGDGTTTGHEEGQAGPSTHVVVDDAELVGTSDSGAPQEASASVSGSGHQPQSSSVEQVNVMAVQPQMIRVIVKTRRQQRHPERHRLIPYDITRTTTAKQLAMAISDRNPGKDVNTTMLMYEHNCIWNGRSQSNEAGANRPVVEAGIADGSEVRIRPAKPNRQLYNVQTPATA